MCDSSSSILIALEITEAKSFMEKKNHASEMSHGAAITLRLCEICGITGTRRVVHGDSFFSSIDTALQLSARGVYFSGIVKTAHAGYPKSFFKDWCVTVTFKLLVSHPNLQTSHFLIRTGLHMDLKQHTQNICTHRMLNSHFWQ